MATYPEIRNYIREQHGIVGIADCHIAHVKADQGLTTRIAHNRRDNETRVNPCPPEKRQAIEEALEHFKMLRESAPPGR